MVSSNVRFPTLAVLGSSIVLLVALLLVPLPLAHSSASERALLNALHFPCFAFLLVLVYATLRRFRANTGRRSLLLAILTTSIIGGASEWAQTLSSRSACWQDFQTNLLGVAAGSATIIGAWLKGSRLFWCRLVPIAGVWVTSVILVARPSVTALNAERGQKDAFPLLGDFEHGWESVVWVPQGDEGGRQTRATISRSSPIHGNKSLKIEARGSKWAGVRVVISNFLPWPESRSLRFDVFNPGDEFDLGIRVDGFEGGRFSGEVHVSPGYNRCCVPPTELIDRDRDLTQPAVFAAKAIVFHLGESPSTRSFYLDNVILE